MVPSIGGSFQAPEVFDAESLDVYIEFKYPKILEVRQGGSHRPIFIPDVEKPLDIFEREVTNLIEVSNFGKYNDQIFK